MNVYERQYCQERQQFKATLLWNEIIDYLTEHLQIGSKRIKKSTHQNSFTGKELVQVLSCFAREKGKQLHHSQLCKLSQHLMDGNVLIRLDSNSKMFKIKKSLYHLAHEKDSDVPAASNAISSSLISKGRNGCLNSPETSFMFLHIYRQNANTCIHSGHDHQIKMKIIRKIAFCRLLQIIEISFLEDILNFQEMPIFSTGLDERDVNNFDLHFAIMNKQNYCDVYRCQTNADKIWVALAFNCLDKQWPEEEGSFDDVSAHEARKELFFAVTRRCDSFSHPLFPPSLAELCKSISNLIETGKHEKACRALQLFLLVIPLNYRIALLKLLLFAYHTINYNILGGIVKIEFIYQNLCSCIFTEDYQNDKIDILIKFMIKYHQEIEFPPDEVLHDTNVYMSMRENENLLSYYQGNVFSFRQPVQQYLFEASIFTKKSLHSLLSIVLNDNVIPVKEKKRFLKCFLKHHPNASFSDTRSSEQKK